MVERIGDQSEDVNAAKLVNYALSVGDEVRSALRKQKKYTLAEYERICNKASNEIEYLSSISREFNYASILRTRAHDVNTKDALFLVYATKIHPEGGETYSYAQMNKCVNQTARMFQAYGLGSESIITLRCTSPEHVMARNAVLANGGTVAPLSMKYGDEELIKRLDLIKSDAVVTTPDRLEQTIRVRENTEKHFHIFVVERNELGEKLSSREKQALLERLTDEENISLFNESRELYPGHDVTICKADSNIPAFLMTTSGSSGAFKVVEIPHSYGLASYIRSNSWWGVNGAATDQRHNSALHSINGSGKGFLRGLKDSIEPNNIHDKGIDRVFCTAPPGWMYFYRGLGVTEMSGATFVMQHTPHKKDIEFTTDVIQRNNVSVFAGIPSLLRQTANHLKEQDISLPSLRRTISTGEMLSADTTEQFFKQTGIEIANGYAATEEGPMFGYPEGMQLPWGAVGLPLPGVDFVLLENNKRGERSDVVESQLITHIGPARELAVTASPVSSTYRYTEGVETTDSGMVTTRDGKTHRDMNDAIVWDEEIPSLVKFIERSDQLLKRYAIQIFPHEIEEELAKVFHQFQMNCTVGLPDPEKGCLVVSYLEIPQTMYQELGEDEVHARIGEAVEKLSSFKKPDYVIVAPVEYVRNENKTFPKRIKSALAELVMPEIQAKGNRGTVILPAQHDKIEDLDHIDLSDASIRCITNNQYRADITAMPVAYSGHRKDRDSNAITVKD